MNGWELALQLRTPPSPKESNSDVFIGLEPPKKDQWFVVDDDVDIRFWTIPHAVELKRFYFKGALKATGAIFARDFQIRNSIFVGPVYIDRAVVHGMLDLRQNYFENELDLSRTDVDGPLYLRGGGPGAPAVFQQPVDASSMVIGGHVLASYGCYARLVTNANKDHGYDATVSWNKTTIMGSASFGSDYVAPVDFSDLTVKGAFGMSGAEVSGFPDTSHACDKHSDCYVGFDGLRVDGPASFHDAKIIGCITFARASFQGLDLALDALAPKQGCQAENNDNRWLNVDGLSYSRILGGADAVKRTAHLLGCLPRRDEDAGSPCSPGDSSGPIVGASTPQQRREEAANAADASFTQLEIAAANQGYRNAADWVHTRGQRWSQERRWAAGIQPTAALMWLDDIYIRYGRAPELAATFCLGVMLVFWLSLWWMRVLFANGNAPTPGLIYPLTCFRLDKWHQEQGTPPLPLPAMARRVTAVYIVVLCILLSVLIYYISSWAVLIPLVAVVLAPLLQRLTELFSK